MKAEQYQLLILFQNTVERLTVKAKMSPHITPILRTLHWLPGKKKIIFKFLWSLTKSALLQLI